MKISCKSGNSQMEVNQLGKVGKVRTCKHVPFSPEKQASVPILSEIDVSVTGLQAQKASISR
jgi:hypothetical protein